MKKERIDKVIANNTTMTRTQVKKLLSDGRVNINSETVRDSSRKIDIENDVVKLDGEIFDTSNFIYIMMNKPAGVVSASRDANSKTVIDLVPSELQRKNLFPAGRLDKDTVGFLLITNDGEFAHKILSPKNHVPKTYMVRISGKITSELVEAFKTGMSLGNDEKSSMSQIKALNDDNQQLVEVVIYEGLYHQIKRMFSRFDLEVLELKRLKIGGLFLDNTIPCGGCKKLNKSDLQAI